MTASSDRGALLDAEEIRLVTAEECREALGKVGMDGSDVRYDATAFRITYRTVGPRGESVRATGMVALPIDVEDPPSLVSFGHWSIPLRSMAPSNLPPFETVPIIGLFVGAGFALAMPDYLGHGGGDGEQLTFHVRSEAEACRDMLLAVQALATSRQVAFDGDLYLTGISQGAPIAIAIAELLEKEPLPGLRTRAVAPFTGVYDLAAWVRAVFTPDQVDQQVATSVMASFLLSHVRTHDLFGSLAEAIEAPWASVVGELFDGNHTHEEVYAHLPGTPRELLRPEAVRLLLEPSGRIREIFDAFRLGDVPLSAPVRLYVADLDEHAPADQPVACADRMRAVGTDVEIVDLGPVDHVRSPRTGMPLVGAWFRSLADEKAG